MPVRRASDARLSTRGERPVGNELTQRPGERPSITHPSLARRELKTCRQTLPGTSVHSRPGEPAPSSPRRHTLQVGALTNYRTVKKRRSELEELTKVTNPTPRGRIGKQTDTQEGGRSGLDVDDVLDAIALVDELVQESSGWTLVNFEDRLSAGKARHGPGGPAPGTWRRVDRRRRSGVEGWEASGASEKGGQRRPEVRRRPPNDDGGGGGGRGCGAISCTCAKVTPLSLNTGARRPEEESSS